MPLTTSTHIPFPSALQSSKQTYYAVLGLPTNPPPTPRDVKIAYHRALLAHHPDKAIRTSDVAPTLIKPTNLSPTTSEWQSESVGDNPVKSPSRDGEAGNIPTVDAIIEAYTTLVSPSKRAAYDSSLASLNIQLQTASQSQETHTGVETYDLEDMFVSETEDGKAMWSRDCRCGYGDEEGKGYVVTEAELDKEVEKLSETGKIEHEIYVGCRGCSLVIRILFRIERG